MSHTPSPSTFHELIASDAYWNGPVAPLESRFTAAWSSKLLHDDQAAEVGRLVLNLEKAFVAHPIAENDTIAQPTENTKRVIRIVQDTRFLGLAIPPNSPIRSEAEQFDEQAEAIETEDLYMGPRADVWTAYSYWRNAKVLKEVYYLRYNSGDSLLYGLGSARFTAYDKSRKDRSVPDTNGIAKPQLIVGQIYHRGLNHRGLTKVVSADILEPGGKLRPRKPVKPPTKNRRSKAVAKSGSLLRDNFGAATQT